MSQSVVKVGNIELLFRPLQHPVVGKEGYDGPESYVKTLSKGHRRTEFARSFEVETIWEKDIEIPLRDGCILRGDVFRPATAGPVPAIIPWSPYGKTGRGLSLNHLHGRMGIPQSSTSGYEKFEAPDPADWTARGYAVVNIDSRGSWDSEGYLCFPGTQEGRDGYDAIEYIAKLPWCDGSVATAGNSWLGRSQWYIAAERPPSLKCIAPLEGSGDLYREVYRRGGIACTPFLEWISKNLRGRGMMEDPLAMLKQYPLMNDYWRDKRANISHIQIPSYILASYSTFMHLPGSLRGYEEISHDKKWLRIHDSQEWHDLYQKSTNDELQAFFDHYLKRVENKWETTPKVRVSLLGYNQPNIINRPFSDWPVPQAQYKPLYLAAEQQLIQEPSSRLGSISYQSDVDFQQMDNDTEELAFRFRVPKKVCLIGSTRAVIYISCDDLDDMDIFLQIRKADTEGNILRSYNVPIDEMEREGVPKEETPLTNVFVHLGPHGQIRASHRAIDQTLSRPHYIQHEHTSEQRIAPGTITKIETSIWPGGIIFEKDEYLVLKISGHPMTLAEFPALRGAFKSENKGLHKVHFGGEYHSHILVPFVDARSDDEEQHRKAPSNKASSTHSTWTPVGQRDHFRFL